MSVKPLISSWFSSSFFICFLYFFISLFGILSPSTFISKLVISKSSSNLRLRVLNNVLKSHLPVYSTSQLTRASFPDLLSNFLIFKYNAAVALPSFFKDILIAASSTISLNSISLLQLLLFALNSPVMSSLLAQLPNTRGIKRANVKIHKKLIFLIILFFISKCLFWLLNAFHRQSNALALKVNALHSHSHMLVKFDRLGGVLYSLVA